ncbi:hypothetical protein C8Q79DRAFT_704049 [Trametes meyenii]|nr:hypothetical protein C8Q79DRAFT_704049 [Trametes meyenii]
MKQLSRVRIRHALDSDGSVNVLSRSGTPAPRPVLTLGHLACSCVWRASNCLQLARKRKVYSIGTSTAGSGGNTPTPPTRHTIQRGAREAFRPSCALRNFKPPQISCEEGCGRCCAPTGTPSETAALAKLSSSTTPSGGKRSCSHRSPVLILQYAG